MFFGYTQKIPSENIVKNSVKSVVTDLILLHLTTLDDILYMHKSVIDVQIYIIISKATHFRLHKNALILFRTTRL